MIQDLRLGVRDLIPGGRYDFSDFHRDEIDSGAH
jgi:hypothetical protein